MRTCSVLLAEDLEKEVQRPAILEIIEKAKKDYYHEFFGIPDTPEMQLVMDLKVAKASNKIIQNVISGKYDASPEDSDEWVKSPEGREAFNDITSSVLNKFMPPKQRKPKK